MAIFPEESVSAEVGSPLNSKAPPTSKEPETANEISSRVFRMGLCIQDARKAFTMANESPSSEDIRKVGISFFIDEGKNGRTTTMETGKNQRTSAMNSGGEAPAKSAPQGGKINYFTPEFDVAYVLEVVVDTGEFDGKFGPSHGYEIIVDSVAYKFTTGSKAIIPHMKEGKKVEIKKVHRDGGTRYDVKEV